MMMNQTDAMSLLRYKITVIGLGYVGLPLAVAFAKKGYQVVGFDIDSNRIRSLSQEKDDKTGEVSREELELINTIKFTDIVADLKDSDVYIVTVPTPIDVYKKPNLTPLEKASQTVGACLDKNNIVIYESTVFPGCTEEFCVPILEKNSGLKYNKDFFCGYSPERINPGDKKHRIHNIVKVTSGSTSETADVVDALYNSIVEVGTHRASSIKVAEAAKVIENSQRDINIAFVNELALIFSRIGIDTHEVLQAAGTKWNFLNFTPGLVGGHCIGVDPYYLTYKAQSLDYNPDIILSGRRINDRMGQHVAHEVLKLMIANEIAIKSTVATILGVTFKENCPDIRNSRVIDIYEELSNFGIDVNVYDPLAEKIKVKEEYNITLSDKIHKDSKVLILAVAHSEFTDIDWAEFRKKGGIIYDVKNVIPKSLVNGRL